jgi:hypothetical protein
MNTISKSQIKSAQVINIGFVESKNSYVVHFAEPQTNGGYKVYPEHWTNSSQLPPFKVGQSVKLIPIIGTDKKERLCPMPA